jgi:hypothetical protein
LLFKAKRLVFGYRIDVASAGTIVQQHKKRLQRQSRGCEMAEVARAAAGADAPEHDEDLYDIEDFEDEAEAEQDHDQQDAIVKQFGIDNDASDDDAVDQNENANSEQDGNGEAAVGRKKSTGDVERVNSLTAGAFSESGADADDEEKVTTTGACVGMPQGIPTANDSDGNMPWLANTWQRGSQETLNFTSPAQDDNDSYEDEAFEQSLAETSDANANKHSTELFDAPVASTPVLDAEPPRLHSSADLHVEEPEKQPERAWLSKGAALGQAEAAQAGQDALPTQGTDTMSQKPPGSDRPAAAEETKPAAAKQATKPPTREQQQQQHPLQRQPSIETNPKSATTKPGAAAVATPKQNAFKPATTKSKGPPHEPQHKPSNQRPESRQSGQAFTSTRAKVREDTHNPSASASTEHPRIRPKTDDRLLQKQSAASVASGKTQRPHTLDGSSRQTYVDDCVSALYVLNTRR